MYFLIQFQQIVGYWILGMVLGSLISVFGKEKIHRLFSSFGRYRAFGIFMAATIGVPLYVCGGGTISLLHTWLRTGMSLGQAASFMITGPATKITNLGALKIILGIKHFVCYIIFTVLFALVTGLVVDFVMRIVPSY
jgi:uncharacterized membrane protein YraQ (UPF0718 family)